MVLAIDIGTSECKVTLAEPAQNAISPIDSEVAKYPTLHCAHNMAEQYPADWWQCVCRCIHELSKRNSAMPAKIEAIGVCGHMIGLVAVDAQGEALRNAIIHADNRAGVESEELDMLFNGNWLYRQTGNVLSASSTLSKLVWFKRNEPDLYNRTAKILQSKDYIVSKLTGNIDITDYSDASHAMLLDVAEKQYLHDVFEVLGIPLTKLPALNRGIDVVGHITLQAAAETGLLQGIPVVAGSGDGACATLGAGIDTAGELYCSLGTTAWLSYVSKDAWIDTHKRTINILTVDGEKAGVFGTSQSAGKVVAWAQRLFGLDSPAELDALAQKAPSGCDGLTMLPYLEGERSPIFDADARGVFFGIGPQHENSHFLRACLEGTAFALRSILDVLREQRIFDGMRIIGGGSHSLIWKQIIADVCGIPIHDLAAQGKISTSLGAAIAACVGVGIYPDTGAAAKLIGLGSTVVPAEINIAVYEQVYPAFLQAYRQLKPVFKQQATERRSK